MSEEHNQEPVNPQGDEKPKVVPKRTSSGEKKDDGTGWSFAELKAKPFRRPRNFATTTHLLRPPDVIPTVYFKNWALIKIHIIVSAIRLEVGWLGTVKRAGSDFLVEDVYLFDQDVDYGHNQIQSESLNSFMSEILKRPDGEEIFNNLLFWGHSHGSGDTHPSRQDEDMMKVFGEFGAEFFIRGIFNRFGEMNISIFDWENNIVYRKVPWRVIGKGLDDADLLALEEELRGEMKLRIRRQGCHPPQQNIILPLPPVPSAEEVWQYLADLRKQAGL